MPQTIDPQKIPGFYEHDHVQPGSKPFTILNGNTEVVVFLHGFTGSPHDFQDFVKPYSQAGFDIVAPLTPGHGSHISHLERLTYAELFIPFIPLVDYLKPLYKKVHIVGLSYGAILTTDLVLQRDVHSVSYLAPAFFLTQGSERNMAFVRRFRLHALKSRIAKAKMSAKKFFRANPGTYVHIPFAPAVALHKHAEEIRPQMVGKPWHVFHAHGDRDETTPLEANRRFLSSAFEDYHFYHVPKGTHVLPRSEGWQELAKAHLTWLEQTP